MISRLIFFYFVLFTFNLQPVIGQEFPKVIIKGDYADPSIVRDGSDYYMTHSPFLYSPGFLIWHSTDLLKWEPITRALIKHTGSAMAPDLIKYKNRFYIYYPAAGTNWVIYADNIRGPWSKPIDLKVSNIDPGHSVGEDGKRYLHLSGGHVIQLADDGLSTIGSVSKIYDGWDFPKEWKTEGKWLESPKILKRNGYFYMTTAEGGTAGPGTSHMVVSARSKNILGPYENSPENPIVHTYSENEKWLSKGHGTIIDDVNGNWWIIYHAYENGYYTLGRQTLIEPIIWSEDGWFHTSNKAKWLTPNAEIVDGMGLSDDFKSKKLGLQWASWGNFDAKSIYQKDNSLFIQGKGSGPRDAQLLLTTATDKSYITQVEVDINAGEGGLMLFYSDKAFAGILANKSNFILYENAGKQRAIKNNYGKHFYLKIINTRNNCDFMVSKDGISWKTLLSKLDVSQMHHNNYKGFFALRIGLMSVGKSAVRFNNFIYHPQPGYLFSYFTDKNENRNGLHLASSADGYKWKAIGNEFSFLKSALKTGATPNKMRDPYIMKGPDSLWHCVWTTNWEDNVIGYASSPDLMNWSEQKSIPVMKNFEAKNCWAPEITYDAVKKRYLIYWSSTIKIDGKWRVEPGKKYDNRIYYTTTTDFDNFEPAKILFDPGHNVIDATIKKVGNDFYMIYKDERELPVPQKNLLVAKSQSIEGPYSTVSKSTFTKNWVEGPAIEQLPDRSFLLLMDAYKDHRYEAMQTTDFVQWKDVLNKVSVPEGAKHGCIAKTTLDAIDELTFYQKGFEVDSINKKTGVIAPKPLFRDPVYDGAADPVVIWNSKVSKWWMFYTNRRATETSLPGVSWVHGTPIGIAESADGANWKYVGVAKFPDLPAEAGGKDATLWAPDIVLGKDSLWHMYLSVVPGISTKWGLPGFIAHFTSKDLLSWSYVSKLGQLGTRVIDADILQMKDGKYRMYYKHQAGGSVIRMCESDDLYKWSDPVDALKINGEGPLSFYWKGYFWLIIDTWNGQTVHRSRDGNSWEKQPGYPLLQDGEGTGKDDIPNGLHANIVISNDRAYLYYFTHPGRVGANREKDDFEQRRTSIQVVELELTKNGWIAADRNSPTHVLLSPPKKGVIENY